MMLQRKKAALELSMTMIIIVVLSLLLLILGFILITKIMCGAVNLTSDLEAGAKDQINTLFSASSAEVDCVGSGDAVSMVAGETRYVYCVVRAPEAKKYQFNIEIAEDASDIKTETLKTWFNDYNQDVLISPGDRTPKKIASVMIPKEAPEKVVSFNVEVTKGAEKTAVWSGILSYKIVQQGAIGKALC